jgi:hypothetical protein
VKTDSQTQAQYSGKVSKPTSYYRKGGLDLIGGPSSDEWTAIQERQIQFGIEQDAIRAEYERDLNWLLRIVEFDPDRVRKVLGIEESPCCRCRELGHG